MELYRYYLDEYKKPEITKITKVFYKQGKMFYELNGISGFYTFDNINCMIGKFCFLYKINKIQRKKLRR